MTSTAFPTSQVIFRWPTAESRTWLAEFLQHVQGDDNIRSVIAVGSSIRPDVDSNDLDLVVVVRDRSRFSWRSPIEVDLRIFDESQLDHDIASRQDLLCWAVKFGKPIFDRGAWREVIERWGVRVPSPDPDAIRRRAERVRSQRESVEEIGDVDAANELRIAELTLLARARLVDANVYPASRPELPLQLRGIGEEGLAQELERSMDTRYGRKRHRTALKTD